MTILSISEIANISSDWNHVSLWCRNDMDEQDLWHFGVFFPFPSCGNGIEIGTQKIVTWYLFKTRS